MVNVQQTNCKQTLSFLDKESTTAKFKQVDTIIQKSKDSINLVDSYIESLFVDMFGDPITNPKSWEIKPLSGLCAKIFRGKQNPEAYFGDIPWITPKDIIANDITNASINGLTISEEEVLNTGNVIIPVGSILMISSGRVGTCSLVGTPLVINQFIFAFQCYENIDSMYLLHNLSCNKDYIKKFSKGSVMAYIDKNACGNIPIMLPPAELQKNFAKKAHKTLTLKQKLLMQHKHYCEFRVALENELSC